MHEKRQNNSPFKQRILQFVESQKLSKREFYKKTGISRGTLENSTGLTEETMAKFIAAFPDINPSWLINGNGEMIITFEPESLKNLSIDLLTKLLKDKDARIEELNIEIGKLREQMSNIKKYPKDIPKLDIAAES